MKRYCPCLQGVQRSMIMLTRIKIVTVSIYLAPALCQVLGIQKRTNKSQPRGAYVLVGRQTANKKMNK